MPVAPRTPVLVGIGFADQRCDDPSEAVEPLELMDAALRSAAEDAGSRALLARAGSIRVPRGFWQYADPGRALAERVGATRARSVLAELGILQQTLITGACSAIAAGEEEVAVVVGGEARFRSQRAGIAGVEIAESQQASQPDVRVEPNEPFWADMEAERGLMMPVQFFAAMENALRYEAGLSLAAHREQVAAMWSAMSRVARDNPHAWSRDPVGADAVATPTPRNRMLAFPYTRQHNSNWNVDQASALVFASTETARALAIPEARWVYPLAAAESNHVVPVSARAAIHACPAIRIAGERALDLAGRRIDDVAHVDLYSCFPAAVRIFANELGLASDRAFTVTGGMAFAGGPLNNYVLESTARMAEVLRDDPGATGLVTCVSGFLNKQGIGVWSTEPSATGFGSADVTEEAASQTDVRTLVDDATGPARIATYTVVYDAGAPGKAIAICDLPDARRSVATTTDPAYLADLVATEGCGRSVVLAKGGALVELDTA